MLDKTSRKVLRAIASNKPDKDGLYTFDYVSSLSGISTKELRKCIGHLEKHGYIAVASQPPYKTPFALSLTHKGIHQKEFAFIATKEFLLKSVFAPIVVAVITTLITLWIKSIP